MEFFKNLASKSRVSGKGQEMIPPLYLPRCLLLNHHASSQSQATMGNLPVPSVLDLNDLIVTSSSFGFPTAITKVP